MPQSILEVAKRADAFFMGTSPIHAAMRRLTDAMEELHIPFAVAGAMAANAHGHKRTTADVNILIRREDLENTLTHDTDHSNDRPCTQPIRTDCVPTRAA